MAPIHQRHDSWTFIASCENGGLCYIHAFNFLPSPVMPNYCLLLGCAATLSFTVALAAQPTPATKPAIPAHPIEAAPKAVPAKVQKEAAAKTPAPPKEPAITFNSVHVDGPYIAMTFDDGPSATLTPKLLDLLAAHHIKATFFVLGEMVAEHPEIRRASRAGRTRNREPQLVASQSRQDVAGKCSQPIAADR